MHWKDYFKLFLITLLLVLFQTNFLDIFLKEAVPILVFVYPLAFLYLGETKKAYYSAFIGGLLLDLAGSYVLGQNSLVFLSFLLVAYYVKTHFLENFLLPLLFTVLFSMGWCFINMRGSLNLCFNPFFVLLNFLGFLIFYLILKKYNSNNLISTFRK